MCIFKFLYNTSWFTVYKAGMMTTQTQKDKAQFYTAPLSYDNLVTQTSADRNSLDWIGLAKLGPDQRKSKQSDI